MGTDLEWPSLGDGLYVGRFVLGVVVGIAAALMLATAPGMVFSWLHRDGYRQTEVVLESLSLSHVTVRVPATGETLSVRRNTFDDVERLGPRRVWYNADARLRLGATVFDDRIVTRRDPRSDAHALLPLLATAGLGLATWHLWRGLLRDAGRST